MRHRFALCLLLVTSCCLAAHKDSTAAYKSLVERARNGDQTVDFRRLRLAYADSDAYDNAPDTDPEKKAMGKALNEKDFHAAIKNADKVLESDYADMEAHYVEYVAYRELNRTDLSDVHNFIYRALLNSITASGDGKTLETAFQEFKFMRNMFCCGRWEWGCRNSSPSSKAKDIPTTRSFSMTLTMGRKQFSTST